MFASSSRLETCTFFTLKGQFDNLTSGQVRSRSGQVKVMSRSDHDLSRCQYAHHPKRLHEPSRLAQFAGLYLHPVATNWRKTDCHLIWPQVTSSWPTSSVAPRYAQMGWLATILKEFGGSDRWGLWIGLCETGSIFIFPHRLIVGRSRNWPDLRSSG